MQRSLVSPVLVVGVLLLWSLQPVSCARSSPSKHHNINLVISPSAAKLQRMHAATHGSASTTASVTSATTAAVSRLLLACLSSMGLSSHHHSVQNTDCLAACKQQLCVLLQDVESSRRSVVTKQQQQPLDFSSTLKHSQVTVLLLLLKLPACRERCPAAQQHITVLLSTAAACGRLLAWTSGLRPPALRT